MPVVRPDEPGKPQVPTTPPGKPPPTVEELTLWYAQWEEGLRTKEEIDTTELDKPHGQGKIIGRLWRDVLGIDTGDVNAHDPAQGGVADEEFSPTEEIAKEVMVNLIGTSWRHAKPSGT